MAVISKKASLLGTIWAVMRARVLVTLLLFYAFGMYLEPQSVYHLPNLFVGFLCVVLWYINGVCINDIADKEIDKINLTNAKSRPLQSGIGTEKTVWTVAGISALVALLLSFYINTSAVWVLLFGLFLNWAYSMKPLRISYRGILAPLMLPVGYVVLPTFIAFMAAGNSLDSFELWQTLCIASVYAGFSGRIILKDFRDVKGDAQFGKRTFLVRYGRSATITYSIIAAVISYCLFALSGLYIPLLFATVFYACILFALVALRNKQPRSEEHITIAAVAKASSGIVAILTAYLYMIAYDKSTLTVFIGCIFVCYIFFAAFRTAWLDRKTVIVEQYY